MKYIAYCRKSTDEKDKQVLSIDAQISELQEFAKREKLEIVDFITEAKTAKAPGREKFAEVLKLVEKGVAGGILSWHPDRLARNSIDGGRIIYLLDIGKLQNLKFPTFWFDNTPQGKFMLNIAFGQSKYYVDNLSENVQRGMRYKAKTGVWPGRPPLGYFNEPKLRNIEVDREKAEIIKKAFELFAEGDRSLIAIARFLKDSGITAKHEKHLKVHSVKVMLSNRFYIGIMNWKGEYYEGNHKQFISKELFQKVQKQIERVSRGKQKGHVFAFCGFMKCRQCGGAITAEIHKRYYRGTNRHVEYTYYRCTKKFGPCTQKPIRDFEMERLVRKAIAEVSLPEAWKKEWYERLEADEINESASMEQNSEKLEIELQELEKKLNKLLDGYLDGVIESEQYKKKKNELFDEKLKLQETLEKIKTDGKSPLEPFREFSENAFLASRTARAKNTNEELAFLVKTVGSKFFLEDRRLVVSYKKGYDTIRAEFWVGAKSAPQPPLVFKVTQRVIIRNQVMPDLIKYYQLFVQDMSRIQLQPSMYSV